MSKQRNGWDNWYDQWDERFGGESDSMAPLVQYEHLTFWGEQLREMVMLNDHWIGYMHPEPMGLEDGMTIAYVLFAAHVDVDELITVFDEFEPLEGAIARVGIPLCWLTDPVDHMQDLLSMLDDTTLVDKDMMEQMRQTLEEMTGDQYSSLDELLTMFRSMSVSTVQFLIDVTEILGDEGRVALKSWWQGRLITLLRGSAATRKRKHGARRKKGPEVPSVFQDLIRGLDMGELGTDEESGEEE